MVRAYLPRLSSSIVLRTTLNRPVIHTSDDPHRHVLSPSGNDLGRGGGYYNYQRGQRPGPVAISAPHLPSRALGPAIQALLNNLQRLVLNCFFQLPSLNRSIRPVGYQPLNGNGLPPLAQPRI